MKNVHLKLGVSQIKKNVLQIYKYILNKILWYAKDTLCQQKHKCDLPAYINSLGVY